MLLYFVFEVLFLLMTSWWMFPLIEKRTTVSAITSLQLMPVGSLLEHHTMHKQLFSRSLFFQLLKLRKNNGKSP